MASKLLNLDDPDLAAAWLIQFEAQSSIDTSIDDENKRKLLFLSKCGVEAIAKLKDLLFPADINAATYEDFKVAIDRVINPVRPNVAYKQHFCLIFEEEFLLFQINYSGPITSIMLLDTYIFV